MTTLDERPVDGWSLSRARSWLRDRAADKGDRCPCCNQMAKVYSRSMLPASALALIAAYRHHGTEPFHMPTVMRTYVPEFAHQGGMATMGAYWGLIREQHTESGTARAGWWTLTDDGVRYVLRQHSIQRHAQLYDGRVLGYDGPLVDITAALRDRFDYDELIGSTPPHAATAEMFTHYDEDGQVSFL